jgi:hypothetical protein
VPKPLTTRAIPLRNRQGEVVAEAIVDEEDYARVMQHKWHFEVDTGYAATNILHPAGGFRSNSNRARRCVLRLHRLIMDLPYAGLPLVDHINLDKLNNSKDNLRLADHWVNSQNRTKRKNTASRFRGVRPAFSIGKWQSFATVHGKFHHLGNFASEEEAAQVAKNFRREHLPYA